MPGLRVLSVMKVQRIIMLTIAMIMIMTMIIIIIMMNMAINMVTLFTLIPNSHFPCVLNVFFIYFMFVFISNNIYSLFILSLKSDILFIFVSNSHLHCFLVIMCTILCCLRPFFSKWCRIVISVLHIEWSLALCFNYTLINRVVNSE